MQDALKNRVVYLRERNTRAGGVHPMRTIISEGKLIHRVTEWANKRRVTKEYIAEGPVACISTTNQDLEIDDQTRHISVWMDESPEQTRRIIQSYAIDSNGISEDEIKVWWTIHELIGERASKVRIVFPSWFEEVASKSFVEDLSVRRYFPAFAEACRTICLIRSFQLPNAAELDELTVSFADFAIAALIFDEAFVESLGNQEDSLMETREAVRRISAANNGKSVQVEDLMQELKIAKALAYTRLRKARTAGLIQKVNENERNNTKLYLPTPRVRFLPDPEELFNELEGIEEAVRFVHPITGEEVEYKKRRKRTA